MPRPPRSVVHDTRDSENGTTFGSELRLQVRCGELCRSSIRIANGLRPALRVAQSGKRLRSRKVKQRRIERALDICRDDRKGRVGMRQA